MCSVKNGHLSYKNNLLATRINSTAADLTIVCNLRSFEINFQHFEKFLLNNDELVVLSGCYIRIRTE